MQVRIEYNGYTVDNLLDSSCFGSCGGFDLRRFEYSGHLFWNIRGNSPIFVNQLYPKVAI